MEAELGLSRSAVEETLAEFDDFGLATLSRPFLTKVCGGDIRVFAPVYTSEWWSPSGSYYYNAVCASQSVPAPVDMDTNIGCSGGVAHGHHGATNASCHPGHSGMNAGCFVNRVC